MPKYKPGDLCYIRESATSVAFPELRKYAGGPTVEIISFEGGSTWQSSHEDWYRVAGFDGVHFLAREICLVKIPPKEEDAGSWDEIKRTTGYSPSRVTEAV